jgi:hypothetical protein
MTNHSFAKQHWPRWLTAGLLLAGFVAVHPSCSNRADFVCAVLEDCELLSISEDECVERVGLAVESDQLDEGEASKCLDCIVEHPCHEIPTYCGQKSCKRVIEAINAELDGMPGCAGAAGAAGAAGDSGSP